MMVGMGMQKEEGVEGGGECCERVHVGEMSVAQQVALPEGFFHQFAPLMAEAHRRQC